MVLLSQGLWDITHVYISSLAPDKNILSLQYVETIIVIIVTEQYWAIGKSIVLEENT